MVCPGANGAVELSVFVSTTSAEVESGTVLLLWFELTPSALACAVFVSWALLTSVAVTLYVAEQVIDSPGSRKLSRSPTVVTEGQVTVVLLSDTVTGPASVAKRSEERRVGE